MSINEITVTHLVCDMLGPFLKLIESSSQEEKSSSHPYTQLKSWTS
jgi:hypothetical protein